MKAIIHLLVPIALLSASCSESGQPGAPSGQDESASSSPTHLDAAGAAGLLKNDPSVVVLDVRTPEEFADGHLAGAINIDFRSPTFAATVSADLKKNQTYLLHCQSGGRSSAALELLQAQGFANLYHLDGGFADWLEAGLPVEK